jgi:hypothetical protein
MSKHRFAWPWLLWCAAPVCAQVTLVGYWDPDYMEDFEERVAGPAIGDYAGLPITEAARRRADSWDASLLTLPEHQCVPHPSTYGFRGVGTLRIEEQHDPETKQLVKIDTWINWQDQHREIWMDGRPAPPAEARHTWQGFSLGHFAGDVLVVETDHLKAAYLRRNGLPLTDRATMKEYFFRHGQILTHVSIVSDPVYLSEPLVRSDGFVYALNGAATAYPCRPAIEIPRPRGEVPNHMPGTNIYLNEYAIKHCVPVEAVRGGAQTALPEYMKRLEQLRGAACGAH